MFGRKIRASRRIVADYFLLLQRRPYRPAHLSWSHSLSPSSGSYLCKKETGNWNDVAYTTIGGIYKCKDFTGWFF